MLVFKHHKLTIFFQDASQALPRSVYDQFRSQKQLFSYASMQPFQQKKLLLFKQVHGTQGYCIDQNNLATFLTQQHEADYGITNLADLYLGAYTADCLPVVLYDQQKQVFAVCHAGWPGTVNKIVSKALQEMQRNYQSNPADIIAIFGPSARVCCYEVQPDFLEHLAGYSFKDIVIQKRSGKLFFDMSSCNRVHLIDAGVPQQSIILKHNLCTICNPQFCSFRRQGAQALRQLTLAGLTSTHEN